MTSHHEVPSWNESRHFASQLRDALASESYATLAEELSIILPSKATAQECIDGAEGGSEEINALAREIIATNSEKCESNLTDPLNQWNDARSLATEILDAAEDDAYDDVAASYESIDFPPHERLDAKISDISGSRTEKINELARWARTWDETEWDTTEADETKSDEDPLSQWNDARHLATRLIDALEGDTGNYKEISADYDSVAFPPADHAQHKIREFTGSRMERINETARWILQWEELDWDGIELQYDSAAESETEPSESDSPSAATTSDDASVEDEDDDEDTLITPKDLSPLEQAAAEILQNFRNHEGRYGSIIQEYSQFDLPPQPEMMMAVRRVQRHDDADAIAELTAEIEEWESTAAASDGSPRSRYVYGSSSQRP